MSQPDKVSEILDSLHEHIEEQKKILDEENKELLEKGRIDFKEALANKQLTITQSNNTSSNASRKNRLNVRHTLKKVNYHFIGIAGFFRELFLKSKKWLQRIVNYLINAMKRRH